MKQNLTKILNKYSIQPSESLLNDLEFFIQKLLDRKRTLPQNNSIHLDCELIAKKLEERGLDMKQVIRLDIPPTMQNVKDNIWRPVMRKMFNKESTTELEKSSGEIDKIHEVIMRELGKEWGIEWHDFPHDEVKRKEYEQAQFGRTDLKYPGPAKEITAF